MSLHRTNSHKVLVKNKSLYVKRVVEDFTVLYPRRSTIPRFINDTIEISLYCQKAEIKVTIPLYVQTQYLEEVFHEAVYKYWVAKEPDEAIKQTAKVIGFQSVDKDILLDYRITIGNGVLDREINFKCLMYQGNRRTSPLSKYKVIKCLAIGGFSKVYLVRSLIDGKFYALKAISKEFIRQNDKENVINNQKSICQKLNHPFIVGMKHCFESRKFVCFVFEYCPGGQLFYYLKSVKRIPEKKAKFYFLEILYGLEYLHQQGIIYRDLKPQNLLIDVYGHIKIADFGLSKENMSPNTLTYSYCGSAEYMPPEMILRSGHSFGVDFYTLGGLLYELVTGLPPFYSQDEEKLRQAILNEQLQFPQQLQLSQDLKMLLKGLLNKNQKLRLGSLKGVKEILFHPWLGKINGDKIVKKQLPPPYVPDVNQFNFDEDELGDDQFLFTNNLLTDSRSKKKFEADFPNFEHQNSPDLKPQQLKILEKLQSQDQSLIITKSVHKSQHSSFKVTSSLKALNPSANLILNRDHSSPYLQSIYRKQRLTSPYEDTLHSSSHKVLLRPKVKRRILPKYINTYISEQAEVSKSKKKNLRKIL